MFQINTLGTISVLKACKENKVKKIINYQHQKYTVQHNTAMDESHPINPRIYATSKLAQKEMLHTMEEQQIPVTF